MSVSRILVIEDAEAIRYGVEVALRGQGYAVLALAAGDTLEDDLARFDPHLVVLDVNLPGRDGFDLLELIRRDSAAAVIMLTARDAPADRVRGLTAGADDYVVKPFGMAELLARVQAVLRRAAPSTGVAVGDLVITEDADRVTRGGRAIDLTRIERRILHELARHPGRVVAKTQLLGSVWGYQGFDANVVEVHVSSLRRKLEAAGPRLIHTVRGRGYRLAADA